MIEATHCRLLEDGITKLLAAKGYPHLSVERIHADRPIYNIMGNTGVIDLFEIPADEMNNLLFRDLMMDYSDKIIKGLNDKNTAH